MDTSTPAINKILFFVCGFAFAAPALFFTYYTVRLIYLNLIGVGWAHRTGGMLIGAIVFPLAAVICGFISWFFLRRGLRTK